MSLIQEALKRKSEEQNRQPAPPSPPPSAPNQPEQPPNTPRLLAVIIIIVLLFILFGAVSWIVLRQPPAAPLPVAPQEQSALLPAKEPDPQGIENEASAPDAKENEGPEQTTETQKEPEAKEIEWPDLRFSGSAAGGSQVLAIINGRMLSLGDQIQGATLLQIAKTEVLVEYRGEKRILKIDNQ